MYTRDRDAQELSARYKRMHILANLIALRNIRIEITLTIEFAEVGKCALNRGADAQDVSHCFAIDDRQCARMRHADRTYVHVWLRLVGIIRGLAEHLGSRCKLRMDLETDGREIHSHRLPFFEDV